VALLRHMLTLMHAINVDAYHASLLMESWQKRVPRAKHLPSLACMCR
jgi:hypothetical protein